MATKKKNVDAPACEGNLWQRIRAVQHEIGAVAKDARVDNKYDAVTHDAVTRALRPLLIKHGIVIVQSLLESTDFDTGVMHGQRNPRPLLQHRARYSIQFVNVDDPSDAIEVTSEGYADDAGDKAPGKAASYAKKYACLKLFEIPTGEDDEERVPEEDIRAATLTEDQVAELYALTKELHGDDVADKKLSDLGKRLYSTEKMADWPAKDFESIKSIVRKNAPKDRSAS